VPLLVDLMPSGRHQMEDFFAAGGVPAVLSELRDRLDLTCGTVTGEPLSAALVGVECYDREVIRTQQEPVDRGKGTAVLRGNLAPDGALIKQSAASPALLVHRGRAVVFDGMADYENRIDDDDRIDADSVLVLRNVGALGYPGMPEVANISLPRRLLEAGVTDVVRVCDGRMSGTAFGTIVLHVAPEAAAGGPLALVRDGDWISLDVPARRLTLDVPEPELQARRLEWVAPPPPHRGYVQLYHQHVLQADRGVDFDFLVGGSGSSVPGRSI
jgi:dihydroxy-acid dehydratase